jgi:oxygen-independent coproporphyrinogen-3 oxidase
LTNDNVRHDDIHDHELLAKYDGRTPRYTSYPTAAQFTPTVGPQAYAEWLAALPGDQAVSLYIHVPFCQRLCWYCGCNTRVVRNPDLISRYVDGLVEELALLARVRPDRLPLAEIHIGGGTPNLLSIADMNLLFSAIGEVFRLTPRLEVSVEGDPASITQDWVKGATAHGVTRVSLGVQDLNPAVQAAVNRTETYEQVQAAVGWLRAAGVRSINFDLMYGLPKQTSESLAHTIGQALTLKPDRVALFGYAHVPWMKAHQQLINEADLPDAHERLVQARTGAQVLEAAGYRRIGLDHFALPQDTLSAAGDDGALRRNFQGYSTDPCDTLIAIGASGIGKMPQGYAQNHTAEIAWRGALNRGELPVARGVALTEDDRFRAEVIERLMCDMAVDLDAICARHGRRVEDLYDEREALKDFFRDGLLVREGETLCVTERGRPFVRTICALFDAHLRPGTTRHAQAV